MYIPAAAIISEFASPATNLANMCFPFAILQYCVCDLRSDEWAIKKGAGVISCHFAGGDLIWVRGKGNFLHCVSVVLPGYFTTVTQRSSFAKIKRRTNALLYALIDSS